VGTNFKDFWSVSCCGKVVQEQTIQLLFGTNFEVFSNKVGLYNSMNLARVSRKIIVGLLGVVRGILLLEIVTCC